jgi:hypothetical protein
MCFKNPNPSTKTHRDYRCGLVMLAFFGWVAAAVSGIIPSDVKELSTLLCQLLVHGANSAERRSEIGGISDPALQKGQTPTKKSGTPAVRSRRNKARHQPKRRGRHARDFRERSATSPCNYRLSAGRGRRTLIARQSAKQSRRHAASGSSTSSNHERRHSTILPPIRVKQRSARDRA